MYSLMPFKHLLQPLAVLFAIFFEVTIVDEGLNLVKSAILELKRIRAGERAVNPERNASRTFECLFHKPRLPNNG